MLKSLYSGISGLQSHQVAMDVESNNIANVNTVGFKYSRANFSDLLAQTSSIATAPQGSLGGKNAVQVGLGTSVDSTTRIFSQGSIQNTDKNTDVAIQGDGFFIVSPDGGNSYKYTRAGDFKFDAGGNFVDNNGFIVQGWTRNEETGKVDATSPISNIQISPGLTTPASSTAKVELKANLNSGPVVENFSAAYEIPSGITPSNPSLDALDSYGNPIASGNMGVMFNESGEAFNLQDNQGVWMSFLSSVKDDGAAVTAGAGELDITLMLDDGITTQRIVTTGGAATNSALANGNRYVAAINAYTSTTGITASYDELTQQISLTNPNSNSAASHNINVTAAAGTSGITTGSVNTAYKYQYNSASANAAINENKTFTSVADLRTAMEAQARSVKSNGGIVTAGAGELNTTLTLADGSTQQVTTTGGLATNTTLVNGNRYVAAINAYTSTTGITASYDDTTKQITLINPVTAAIDDLYGIDTGVVAAGAGELNTTLTLADGTTQQITTTGGVPTNTTLVNGDRYAAAINAVTNTTGITASYDDVSKQITLTYPDASSVTINDLYATAGVVAAGAGELNTTLTLADGTTQQITTTGGVATNTTLDNGDRYAAAINAVTITTGITASYDDTTKQITLTYPNPTTTTISDLDGTATAENIEISVNSDGKFEIINPGGSAGDYDINLQVTAFSGSGITENTKFTSSMSSMNSILPVASGGKAYSQSFNAATHSSGIDIYDSLGSKHTIRTDFRKTAMDTATGSTWEMIITVPEPATIDTVAPTNEKKGSIKFNNDGSLQTFNPPNLSFSANNGSAAEQQISLSLGTANAFDGMTSFDSKSSTSGISQDGYTGGDLVGIRIDQSGTVVGSFSNGRSFGLAQVSMAKFTNNEGLATEGGNVYVQTANSGDPVIGTAATSGRGFIQSSALEQSNVDLSLALTQLIIIQRGYQANGKTITTSDALLETLIGLKR